MENKKSILDAAICEFKLNVGKITKDKNNPFFKSKYADLAIILDVIDDDLAKAGLTLKSKSLIQEGAWVLRTDLKHKDSDEVEFSTFPIFGTKPQEIGSSITYARRYNIQSLLNLAAEDDDGNAANKARPVSGKPSERLEARNGSLVDAGFKTAIEAKNDYVSLSKLIDDASFEEMGIKAFMQRIKDNIQKHRIADIQSGDNLLDILNAKVEALGLDKVYAFDANGVIQVKVNG